MQSKHIIFVVIILFLTSCSKFLEVTPSDKQTGDQLFTTKSGFYMASNGVYEGLASNELYGRNMSYQMIDILAKRYKVINANILFRDLSQYNYASTEVSPVLSNVWQKAYSVILASNLLYENIDKHTGILNKNESDVMKGEMLAVRAFLHFDMLRLFGPRFNNNGGTLSIPYNESTDISVLPLLPFDDVIEKIIRDLKEAEALLSVDPVIENGPMASHLENESIQLRYRQYRFNYYAVKALKARVLLYCGKKAEALVEAKSILNNPKVSTHFPAVNPDQLLGNYSSPDRVFSTEVLSGIYVENRDEAYTQFFSSESAGSSFLQPHRDFLTYLFSFVSGQLGGSEAQSDYRFQTQWEPSNSVGVAGHIFTKYKPIKGPNQYDATSEYHYSKMISLIRLSEVYYIAAECEPVLSDKFNWINEMRKRRGMDGVDPMLYPYFGDEFIFNSYLVNEYIREFNGEGQVFFLLKRLAFDLSYENGEELNYATYSDNAYRPPLPVGEMK